MYSLHMVTSKEKSVFFECVSKYVIHSTKNYPNVILSQSLLNYMIYAAVRNCDKTIKIRFT